MTSPTPNKVQRIAIFASGKGSNANNIISFLKNIQQIKVGLVITDNAVAGVIGIAEKNSIPFYILSKEDLIKYESCLDLLKFHSIDYIVLAGYLKKIPSNLIENYPDRIINIHPALLPKYGGKGMYGNHVHEAVIANKETISGITIHLVDEVYDHGKIIFQESCELSPNETVSALAEKIHQLEYAHYPRVICEVIEKRNQR